MVIQKKYECLCLDCGGSRQLSGSCLLCGSNENPEAITETLIFNIEWGYPTVDEAVERFEIYLESAFNAGFKSMILVHGYGSSGVGGKIKNKLRSNLNNNFYTTKVKDYFFGENLIFGSLSYNLLIETKPFLEKHKKQFTNNPGVCVLIFMKVK